MRLTLYSDYSFRVMIYLALHREKRSSISQISNAYGISRNHLVKVVHNLARLGFVKSNRGRGGGIEIGSEPSAITLGQIARRTEPTDTLVECFDAEQNTCCLARCCDLKGVLAEAQEAFFKTLDRYTLADVISNPKGMRALLQIKVTRKRAVGVA